MVDGSGAKCNLRYGFSKSVDVPLIFPAFAPARPSCVFGPGPNALMTCPCKLVADLHIFRSSVLLRAAFKREVGKSLLSFSKIYRPVSFNETVRGASTNRSLLSSRASGELSTGTAGTPANPLGPPNEFPSFTTLFSTICACACVPPNKFPSLTTLFSALCACVSCFVRVQASRQHDAALELTNATINPFVCVRTSYWYVQRGVRVMMILVAVEAFT